MIVKHVPTSVGIILCAFGVQVLPAWAISVTVSANDTVQYRSDVLLFTSPVEKVYYGFLIPSGEYNEYSALAYSGVSTYECYGFSPTDTEWCSGGKSSGVISSPGSFVRVSAYLVWGGDGTSVTAMASGGGTPQEPEKYCDSDGGDCIYVPPGDGENTINEGPSVATDTSGGYLTSSSIGIPVVQEHGLTDFVWTNAEAAEPLSSAVPFKAAYFFASYDIPFTQFIIPEALPGGDSEFTIIAGDFQSYPLQAGVAFDFTTYFSEGVTAFLLTGFDAEEGLLAGEPFPYTHGYRFAEEGATFVRHGPLSPGDFTMGGLVDGDDLAIWQASYGVNDGGDADGDGRRDFLVWQRNVTATEVPTGVVIAVPEPTSVLLIALISVALLMFRLQNR